jgi:hypothetical protein
MNVCSQDKSDEKDKERVDKLNEFSTNPAAVGKILACRLLLVCINVLSSQNKSSPVVAAGQMLAQTLSCR